jgi:hypothetical protein
MRKEQLIKKELVASQSGLNKFSTQENNIFIYDVQLGWGYNHNILADQKDQRSNVFQQKSIINTYSDNINGKLVGKLVSQTFTRGLKSQYYL